MQVDKTLEMLIGTQEKCSEASEPVGPLSDRVKPLLEEVLRHAIAVAYCSVKDDNKLIMAMCENVSSLNFKILWLNSYDDSLDF